MARRRIIVRDISEILGHWQAGRSIRAIARSLGTDRKTIKKYVKVAVEQGFQPAPDGGPPEGWGSWVARNFPRSSRGELMPTAAELDCFRKDIVDGLKGACAATVWQRLRDEKGLKASLRSFRRYVERLLPQARPAPVTVRRDDPPPGEEAQVDFGYLGLWQDPVLGVRRKVYAFAMVLSCSRFGFARAFFRMDQQAWQEGHIRAFEFWGGVPERVILDNLKAGVIKPDLYDPRFNRGYEELAHHYGFLIDPARAGKPRDKARIERLVPYVRNSFWKGRDFGSPEEINHGLQEWCLKVAGQRIHGTTRRRPSEEFEAVERGVLKPLPPEPFEMAAWHQPLVAYDCHIQVGSAVYSVPYQYRGQRLDVRLSESRVECYLDHELVKTHPRVSKGRRHTDWSDYPPEKAAFFERTPKWCQQRAAQLGPEVEKAVVTLLGEHQLHYLRQSQGIIHLADKYGAGRLNAACARANAYGLPAYQTIKNILEKGLDRQLTMTITTPPIAGAFLRGPEELFNAVYKKQEIDLP
ncbi:MAG: IS21 family transposase [Chloroflexi bacterium]|nr:IS21 family transposase [Chloroflexota bacterium]